MDDAVLHRRRSGGEGLPEHLPAENLRAADIAALATKQVDLQLLELEQRQQVGDALVQSLRAPAISAELELAAHQRVVTGEGA